MAAKVPSTVSGSDWYRWLLDRIRKQRNVKCPKCGCRTLSFVVEPGRWLKAGGAWMHLRYIVVCESCRYHLVRLDSGKLGPAVTYTVGG